MNNFVGWALSFTAAWQSHFSRAERILNTKRLVSTVAEQNEKQGSLMIKAGFCLLRRKMACTRATCWFLACFLLLLELAAPAHASAPRPAWLQECLLSGVDEPALCGHYPVFENRGEKHRKIDLKVVVIPAKSANPAPDPIFLIVGGPGGAATDSAGFVSRSVLRERRDIVLIDQRGSRGSNPLTCDLPDSDNNLQSYFEDVFEESTFSQCRELLAAKADIRYYTTVQAIEDLDEVREALRYKQINLLGWSYGTRFSLQYAKAFPERVRTLILNGVVPVSLKNPLPHAKSAQQSIDAIFAACAEDSSCKKAFPNLHQEFQQVLERLHRKPAQASVKHPVFADDQTVLISKNTFVEILRITSYNTERIALIPKLVNDAYQGRFDQIAEMYLKRSRTRARFPWGMLLAVTCAEDVSRITEGEIAAATSGTALGDFRVRRQMKVCADWPTGSLPEAYTQDTVLSVPAVLWSGIHDPVTPVQWGNEVQQILPNSLHIAVPGGHIVGGKCLAAIQHAFIEAGTVNGLDIGCANEVKLPKFVLSD